MLKTRASYDSLNVDTLSGKGKFSLPTLRRYSSTTNLHQEHVNTPQILHRSLSSIFKKIPKTLDEKNENDNSLDDDNASIISSDSSQISFDDNDTKPKKFISIFNNAFNSKNNNNNNNHNNSHKRKKYNFNEIIVSNEIIITHSNSKDMMDEHDIGLSNVPFPTYETHLQTPTQNYSYYYPHKDSITAMHGKDLHVIPDEEDENDLNEEDVKEIQTSPTELTSSKDTSSNSDHQVLHACSASTTPISSPNESNKEESSQPPLRSLPFKVPPMLSIPPPPLNPPVKLVPPETKMVKRDNRETSTKKVTETWPFARFPQRSAFYGLSYLPPSNPLTPSDIPLRSRKTLPSPVLTKSHDPNYYNYGVCERCKKTRTGILWCQSCYSLIFQRKFRKWTSGSDKIDDFIRKNQLNSNNICELFEWIPFEKFRDLQLVGEGGYSTVYSAKWIDGRILDLNEDGKWERTGENEVVLKILFDSKDPSKEFLNQLNFYQKCTPNLNNVLRCYGISRDPFAKNTIMVMEYAKDGNLKDYLKKKFAEFTWIKRITILNDITQSLKSIHEAGLVHKNLHSGNVLIHENCAFIGDLGLCSKVQDEDPTLLYGVMPYVAPEVLRGNQFTASSDIYSFGMIMYELAISLPPYHDYSSDESLLRDICDEVRPKIPEGIPKCYVELMTECWSQNPEDRPKADYLAQIIEGWKEKDFLEEFKIAEKFRLNETDKHTDIREKLLGNYKSKVLPKFCEISST